MSLGTLYNYIIDIFPIIQSIIVLIFTIYINIYYPKKTNIVAYLIWDEIKMEFFVLIKNIGNAPIVIDYIELIIDKNISLGKRQNICNINEEINTIEQGKAFTYTPIQGSRYDILGYKGHTLDVTKENKQSKIYIKVKELEGKTFKYPTNFTLGELDQKLYNKEKTI